MEPQKNQKNNDKKQTEVEVQKADPPPATIFQIQGYYAKAERWHELLTYNPDDKDADGNPAILPPGSLIMQIFKAIEGGSSATVLPGGTLVKLVDYSLFRAVRTQ